MLITAAAVRRLYSMKYILVKLIRPMVTTFIWGLLITTIGQKNSFQLHMNLMISNVAMAGFTDGRITEKKIRILAQWALTKNPELADVPLFMDQR